MADQRFFSTSTQTGTGRIGTNAAASDEYVLAQGVPYLIRLQNIAGSAQTANVILGALYYNELRG